MFMSSVIGTSCIPLLLSTAPRHLKVVYFSLVHFGKQTECSLPLDFRIVETLVAAVVISCLYRDYFGASSATSFTVSFPLLERGGKW